jgi:formylglycine-generating enzyme required for sulfatase activity
MHTSQTETFINDQMVEIPGGKIELRDDRTKQKWTVNIEPFMLAKYPVTQDLFFEVTKETPSAFIGGRKPVETITWNENLVVRNHIRKNVIIKIKNPIFTFYNQNK